MGITEYVKTYMALVIGDSSYKVYVYRWHFDNIHCIRT